MEYRPDITWNPGPAWRGICTERETFLDHRLKLKRAVAVWPDIADAYFKAVLEKMTGLVQDTIAKWDKAGL